MSLKTRLLEHEKFGLTEYEILMAEKWVRKYKTAGIIPETESLKLFQLYLIGTSIAELAQQFPRYPLGQIALTAAIRGWPKDREKSLCTLKDQIKAKVIKSVVEQVDFLTSMLAVSNVEHLSDMKKYIIDPENNQPPELRIKKLADYKEVVETLQKLISGVNGGKALPLKELMEETQIPEKRHGIQNKQKEVKQLESNDNDLSIIEILKEEESGNNDSNNNNQENT